MFPIGLGMVELRSAFANDMPNLRAAGFPPPPPGYCNGMQGALHASAAAMGHHPDATGMSAATVTGAASFFPHHLGPGSLRHHANLMTGHNHQSGAAGPFGILPHEAVNLMNSATGGTTGNSHHSHPHSHAHPHPHAPRPPSISSHATSSNGYNNKSCSIESNKYYHHHHHHHKNNTNSSSSFGDMMSTMSQNVYTGAAAAAAAARGTTRSSFDHQLSKQLAHAHHSHPHHQTPDPYFSNFLMSTDNYAASQYAAAAAAANMRVASNQHMLGISNSNSVNSRSASVAAANNHHSQYPSMNFPNSLARDFMNFGSNSHSFKHGSSSSCHNQTRANVNSAITGNNHLNSCNMMMSGLTPNSYYPNHSLSNSNMIGSNNNVTSSIAPSAPTIVTNHGSTSRSSSVASNHAIQQGSESSSCSYGYNSPSTTIPHSPYQKRSSVSTTPSVVSSQTPTAITSTGGVQDFPTTIYTNSASVPPYSTLGTPVGLSASAYPTPPSSVNQQIPPQSGGNQQNAQDDTMRGFHVNSQNNGASYPTTFSTSPYPTPKMSSNSSSSSTGSLISNNSSCMVAAAAAAAAASSTSNSSTGSVNYLHGSLTASARGLREGDTEACLSSIANITPMSDAMSNSSKLNESQLNNSGSVDPVISSEPTLNSVFNGSEIEFPGLTFPMVEASAAANYAQQMRIDGTTSNAKKKKEKTKKSKKKEKNKSLDRIPLADNSINNSSSFSLFPFHHQTSSHYHEGFPNTMSQTCNSFLQSHHNPHHHHHLHHQSPAQLQTQVQTTVYAKSSSTPYTEPSSSSTNQQQLQQVPQTSVASISQQQQPPPPLPHPSTGPPPHSTPSLTERPPSHLQSQSNLLTHNELVPRVSPSCFDTTLNNLQPNLLSSGLCDQLSSTGSQHSNHGGSSLEYAKSHQDNASQSMAVQHPSDNTCGSANLETSENDNHLSEKFSSLEDDLSFLTAATNECEASQVEHREIETQIDSQIVPTSESHGLPMDQHHSQHPSSASAPSTSLDQNIITTSTTIASTSTPNLSCAVESMLTNSCATTCDQIEIKTSAANSKAYQTDFLSEAHDKISTAVGTKSAIDINNSENKMNEPGIIKKKKKIKESKAKSNCQTKVNSGQSSSCNNNLNSNSKSVDSSSIINIVPVNDSKFTKLSSSVNNNKCSTTCKPMEITNIRKPGDMRDHEARFFKMRPVSNTTTIVSLNAIQPSNIKSQVKNGKKRKVEETNDHKSALDEYEFPDSPTNPMSTKKAKKINSENSKKKTSEKLLINNLTTVNKKLSLGTKNKLNSNPGGNSVLTKLNLNEKSETVKIAPRPVNQQLNCNKVKLEDKALKSLTPNEKKQQYGSNNQLNQQNQLYQQQQQQQQQSNQPQQTQQPQIHLQLQNHHQKQQQQRNIKEPQKQTTTMTVQEIISPAVATSQPCTKNNAISIVSITKKPSATVSNQTKKELQHRTTPILSNTIQTSTLTTIVPITASALNTSIIIGSATAGLTAIAPQPAPTHIQPQLHHQFQSSQAIKTSVTQSVSMTSAGTNTPRRRSQDKKALTIREGLMRTGDFVVSLDEAESELPMIWRIEGKSLLQRFEPSEQDGQIVYTNTSSYSAWNPTVKQRYIGVDVRIMGCNRTKIVVEKLGLTKSNVGDEKPVQDKIPVNNTPSIVTAQNGEAVIEKSKPVEEKPSNNFQHQADFEVFIQTLISQALDANFISEIIKENDEYFLSHLQAIDDYCVRKKSRFFTKVKWDAHIVKCVETFSSFNVIPQSQVGDLRCRLCHDNWSTQILHFTGKTYDQVTLETKEPVDIKQTKYAACDECKEKVTLFSNLHHQKYNFFTKCREKVEEMQGGVEDKDSPMILEECLKDTDWMQSLFKQFEEIWQSCDRIR